MKVICNCADVCELDKCCHHSFLHTHVTECVETNCNKFPDCKCVPVKKEETSEL